MENDKTLTLLIEDLTEDEAALMEMAIRRIVAENNVRLVELKTITKTEDGKHGTTKS